MSEYTGSILFIFCIIAAPSLYVLVCYYRRHPYVNADKLKRRLEEAAILKKRLSDTEQLLTDIDLTTMKRRNIRGKGITITWSDSTDGEERTMNFIVDGNSLETKALEKMCVTIQKQTWKKLMKTVYKLPKRTSPNDSKNAYIIHGIDD